MRRTGIFLVVLTIWCGFGLARAEAGLLPVNVTITPDGNNHRYSYAVVLPSDSILRTGDFFTIYDFQGLVQNSNIQPADFAFSSSLIGNTPSGTIPSDNPFIDNITWTYTGPDTVVGQAGLGNFMVQSTYSSTTDGYFTARTHRQVDGKQDSNITFTDVPVPTATPQVPEPATLALVGMSLPLLGLMHLLRRRRSTDALQG